MTRLRSRLCRIGGGALALVALHWIAVEVMAARNQARIERFFQESGGARTLEEFAPGGEKEPLHDNGWPHLIAAIACISEATGEALVLVDDEIEVTWTEAERKGRERDLDRVHVALGPARTARRIVPIVQWNDPLAPFPMHEVHDVVQAAIHSAREAIVRGDTSTAEQRVRDAWFVVDQTMGAPMWIPWIVLSSGKQAVLRLVAESLDRWPTALLTDLDGWLNEAWRPRLEANSRGDVYRALQFFDATADGRCGVAPYRRERYAPPGFRVPRGLNPSGLYRELEKSCYLDLALAFVASPLTPDAWPSPPFYASGEWGNPSVCESLLKSAQACAARRAAMREAIRLELARRKDGAIPTPRKAVDGFALDIQQTDGGVSIGIANPTWPEEDFRVTVGG